MRKQIFNWVFLLRITLGLSLTIKGIQFIQNNALIRDVFNESLVLQRYFWLQTIVPVLNIICGFLIILGLFTRVAAIIQIPILVGAIIFVHAKKGLFAGESGLAFSILILLALIFFAFQGGGAFSWDESNKKENPEL